MPLSEEQSENKEVAYLDSYRKNRYCKGQKANSSAYLQHYDEIKWDKLEENKDLIGPRPPNSLFIKRCG